MDDQTLKGRLASTEVLFSHLKKQGVIKPEAQYDFSFLKNKNNLQLFLECEKRCVFLLKELEKVNKAKQQTNNINF